MNIKIFKSIIAFHKAEVRKKIANINILAESQNVSERTGLLKQISREKEFLKHDFNGIDNTIDAVSAIHKYLHKSASQDECHLCDLYRVALDTDIRPRFGNLIAILQEEVNNEKTSVESKHLPSQNDLTRWALKSSVLEFYKNMNMPDDLVIVETQYDDRLLPKLAPDFDVIANLWIKKLEYLQHQNSKYMVEPEEYDKAEADLQDGMRGSAFEKQLDRFREEFMAKLKR